MKFKKFLLIVFSLLSVLYCCAEPVSESEKEYREWQKRYKKVEKMPYRQKLDELRKIVKNKQFFVNSTKINYELLLASDLVEKKITNRKYIEIFIDNAYYYNITKSRLRIKDPLFNIFFESNVLNDSDLLKFYDKLVKNEWMIDDISVLNIDEQKDLYDNLRKVFNWDESERSEQYIENALVLLKLYFQHPDFQNNYLCPNTAQPDTLRYKTCYAFLDNIFAISNSTFAGLENEFAVRFMEQKLKESSTDTSNLAYFINNVYFDKEMSNEISKTFDSGDYSPVYALSYQRLSVLEREHYDRSVLVHILKNNSFFTDEQKTKILSYSSLPVEFRRKTTEKIMRNDLIKDKDKAYEILCAFDKKATENKIENSLPEGYFQIID